MEYALVRGVSSWSHHLCSLITSNQPVLYSKSPLHCKDTIPKIRNKDSQERNRVATVSIHVSVSDLCNRLTGLPILLQENRWAGSGNIYIAQRHWKLGNWDWGRAIPFLRIYKFKFLCSAMSNVGRGLLYMQLSGLNKRVLLLREHNNWWLQEGG